MKILIAPDSFKGSLSSKQVAEAIAKGLKQTNKDFEINILPLADGGEGTAECLLSLENTKSIETETVNIFFEKMSAPVLVLCDNSAFVETALASGLATVKRERLNPLKASTFGTGLISAVKT